MEFPLCLTRRNWPVPKPAPADAARELTLGLFRWLREHRHTRARTAVAAKPALKAALLAHELTGPAETIATAFLQALDTYLHFLLLAGRAGVDLPADVAHRVEQMVDFLLALRQPDSSIPSIGDDDGGTLLPLTRRAPGDARGTFALAAALFGRGVFRWAAEGVGPEVYWLMGTNAALNAAHCLRVGSFHHGSCFVMALSVADRICATQ